MSQDKTTGNVPDKFAHESEAEKAKREAGTVEHSSHDHTSRERAGTHEGAGGGAKQKQNH
jgi:hypothetical protein